MAAGYQVLATLTQHDQVAVVGVAGSVARPAAPCMRSALTPATHHVLQTARHFLDYMEIQNGMMAVVIDIYVWCIIYFFTNTAEDNRY